MKYLGFRDILWLFFNLFFMRGVFSGGSVLGEGRGAYKMIFIFEKMLRP